MSAPRAPASCSAPAPASAMTPALIDWAMARARPIRRRPAAPNSAPASPAPVAPAEHAALDVAQTVMLRDVEPQELRWLWPGRIPMGKLTLLAGDPGLGKSLVTLDMAARVSSGAPWPDDLEQPTRPGGVVLISCEDGLADTVRPRLDAARADVARIAALTGVRCTLTGGVAEFHLDRDVPRLADAIARVPDPRLVVIDPVSAYLGHADSHNNAAVRALLRPLAEMADRLGVAVVVVTHLNKQPGGKAINRSSGSLAFAAAARAVWMVTRDEADEDRRTILPVKLNLGARPSGLAYRVRGGSSGPVVAWEDAPVLATADEALAGEEQEACTAGALEEAVDFLRQVLADGPRGSAEVQAMARTEGIAERTLRRARGRLGVRPRKRPGEGRFEWALPA